MTSWRTVPEYQGGFLLDGGVHFAAGLAAMLGPIASVNGCTSLHRQHLAPSDTCLAMCKTESGIDGVNTFHFYCSHRAATEIRFLLDLCQTLTMSMGASPTLSKTETIISCQKGHIELAAGNEDEGGWRLTVHEEDQLPFEEYVSSFLEHTSTLIKLSAIRRFPSTGVYDEIRSFAESIQALRKGEVQAESRTAHKALKDLAFIEACIIGNPSWTQLDSLQ